MTNNDDRLEAAAMAWRDHVTNAVTRQVRFGLDARRAIAQGLGVRTVLDDMFRSATTLAVDMAKSVQLLVDVAKSTGAEGPDGYDAPTGP